MKRSLYSVVSAALALCLLLSLAACGGSTSGKIPGGEHSAAAAEPAQPEKTPDSKNTEDRELSIPVKKPSVKNDEESTPIYSEAAKSALDLLRQCMDGTAQAAAVAYLGWRDESERGGDLTDWLWTNVPGLMENMSFLQYIPADRVLNGDHGDLYCIVPLNDNTSLSVDRISWRSNGRGVWPETDEVLYRSEYGEPLLLFVRWEEFPDEPDVEVVAVADSGAAVTWHPVTDAESGGGIVIPTGENYEALLLDFSRFGDVTGADYGGDMWLPPTELGLADTTWNCGSWMMELRSGGGDPEYAGTAGLYYQLEDGQEYQPEYNGVWRMEDDCLRLELSAGVGTSLSGSFPVLIDLAGEHLVMLRDAVSHAGLPFFDDFADTIELTLSYG